MYKPRSTRDIYIESLSVNSENLKKQLGDKSVPAGEIKGIMGAVSKMYNEHLEKIVEECDRDMMALESMPSPLKLFVDCLAQAHKSLGLSPPAHALLRQYVSAWEDWM
jgi:hypothetical protein